MLPVQMFGGAFSEHWIDGQRCGPLPRRHSGKGRAVPKRCPSISAFFAPFGGPLAAAIDCVVCFVSMTWKDLVGLTIPAEVQAVCNPSAATHARDNRASFSPALLPQ